MKKVSYRPFLCFAILVLSGLWGAFMCRYSFLRLWDGILAFGNAAAIYFLELLQIPHDLQPLCATLPEYPVEHIFPFTLEQFREKLGQFFPALFRWESLQGYLIWLSDFLRKVLIFFMMLGLPIFLLLRVFWARQIGNQNNDYGGETRPLQVAKKVHYKVFAPIYAWCRSMKEYAAALGDGGFVKLLVAIWLFNANVIAFGCNFLAFYLVFAATFDFSLIPLQLYKLLLDICIAFRSAPLPVWIVLGLIAFDKIRRSIGLRRLYGFEAANADFLDKQPLVMMIVGSMGKGKTKLLTDLALTQESLFRERALADIYQYDLHFPAFPWIQLERTLTEAVEQRKVTNLESCRAWMETVRQKFAADPVPENLFGYDFERYPLVYEDGLRQEGIFEALEGYACLFLIWSAKTALCYASYPVRFDSGIQSAGNFPMWQQDFFSVTAEEQREQAHFAHILDFDAMRLGKTLADKEKSLGAYEIGSILITEVGKERGNAVELEGVKKQAEEANQRNDMLNAFIKLIRHPSTIHYFPYARIITDDQRPESWGADARDLCSIVHIAEAGAQRLTLPFFALEGLLYELFFPRFRAAYYRYRFSRGNNTLFMTLYKKLMGWVYRHYTRLVNQFGYQELLLQTEAGTMDGEKEETVYRLMNKKIYSNRYSTDCFSDIFRHRAAKHEGGIDDAPTYGDVRSTLGEMELQNSYFVADLMRLEHEAQNCGAAAPAGGKAQRPGRTAAPGKEETKHDDDLDPTCQCHPAGNVAGSGECARSSPDTSGTASFFRR